LSHSRRLIAFFLNLYEERGGIEEHLIFPDYANLHANFPDPRVADWIFDQDLRFTGQELMESLLALPVPKSGIWSVPLFQSLAKNRANLHRALRVTLTRLARSGKPGVWDGTSSRPPFASSSIAGLRIVGTGGL